MICYVILKSVRYHADKSKNLNFDKYFFERDFLNYHSICRLQIMFAYYLDPFGGNHVSDFLVSP